MTRVHHILNEDDQVIASIDLEFVKTISSGYNKYSYRYLIFINDEMITGFKSRQERDDRLTELCRAFEEYKNNLVN